MKYIKYVILVILLNSKIGFGFSLAGFMPAPKASKIGATVTIAGDNFNKNPNQNDSLVVFIGKVKARIDSVNAARNTITLKNPVGKSAKGGMLVSQKTFVNIFNSVTFYTTIFNQNSTNNTFSGGTSGTLAATTFETQVKPLSFVPSSMVLVDYYNQGYLNAFFGNSNNSVNTLEALYNDISVPYNLSNSYIFDPSINAGQSPNRLIVTESNSNGYLDIVSYSPFDSRIHIKDYNVFSTFNTLFFASEFIFSDVDGDNKLDLIKLNTSSLEWQKNVSLISNFSFTGLNPTTPLQGPSPTGVNLISADLDNDNKQEIIVSVRNDQPISFSVQLYTVTSLNLVPIDTIRTPSRVTKIENTDLNSDGYNDLVLQYDSQNSFAVIENKYKNGSFKGSSPPTFINISIDNASISDITTGDIDGDAVPEIIVAYTNFVSRTSKIRVYKSNFLLNPTTHQPINSSSFLTFQDYNTNDFFDNNPILGLEVADISADGKNDIVAYGSDPQGIGTTSGIFMVLLNKSCNSPEVRILNEKICPDGCLPTFACSGTPYNVNATAIGDNLSYTWEVSVYNEVLDEYENINIQNNPQYSFSANANNLKLSFISSNADTNPKSFKISVNGSCGVENQDFFEIDEVLNSPTLTQTITGLCNEPLLVLGNIGGSQTVIGSVFYNGKIVNSNEEVPTLTKNYKPILAGNYAMEVELNGTDNNNSFYTGKCKSNEVSISKIENTFDITAKNESNFTTFSAKPNQGAYRWFLNGRLIVNQTTSGFSTNYKGNYSVEFTDISGCKSVSNPIIVDNPAFFDVPNGRGEITLNLKQVQSSFNFYPNPSSGILNIDLEDISQKTNVKIMDNLGNIKREVDLNNYNNQIDVSSLFTGVYMLKITQKEIVSIHKLIIF